MIRFLKKEYIPYSELCVQVNHRVKIKENKKREKYLDLARGLRKLWNMQMMVIPIIIGALRVVAKTLESGLDEFEIGRGIETIQNTGLLRSARILRRVLGTCGHSRERPSGDAGVK